MATSSMADHVGRVLGGRYRLVAPIGTGASAHVFLADDVTLKRRVAVKVLHAALAEDESFLRRFRAEAHQAAALTHPNVMRVFDWGESGDGPYLVLEHLAGGSLRDMLDQGTGLTPSQALLVGLEAARALDYAHRRGLVHRDIKPANLLFDDEGRVCIADFGLARALAEAAWTEPAGAVLGTARYASPEQAQGRSADGKADVYALALVLVESVTGRVPFTADTTIATLMARVGATLDPAPELGALGPVLARAAAPEVADRLDARQLARALEEVARQLPEPDPFRLTRRAPPSSAPAERPDDLTELGVAGPRPAPASPADDTGPVAGPAGDQPPYVLPVRRRRRRWLVALVIVLTAALGGGAAYAIVQARIPTHPVPPLRGKTVAEARAEVADEKFKVEVAERRYDDQVPEGRVIEQDPSLGTLREGRTIDLVVSKGGEPRDVPDLAGLDQAGAEQALQAADLVPAVDVQPNEDVEKGRVVDWAPRGSSTKGSRVTVTVSAGAPQRDVPDLGGRSFDDAKALLAERDLKAAKSEKFSGEVDAGLVMSTNPDAGQKVDKGGTVTVVVSKGPDIVQVPDVRGRSVEEAKTLLTNAGLRVREVAPPRGRQALFTFPEPGTTVARGTDVTIYAR